MRTGHRWRAQPKGLRGFGWAVCALCLILVPGLSGLRLEARASGETEEPLLVRHPKLVNPHGQSQESYMLKLLALALDKSGREFQLQPVSFSPVLEARSLMSIKKGLYDLHWMHTNPKRESQLHPIRIPLFKGLIGWRLLLIKAGDERFAGVKGLSDLKAFQAVQGHDWPDSDILEHNGLPLVRTASWKGMFKMLAAGRVDYFPRSVFEIWGELARASRASLEVDKHLALVYPSAYYFFVHPKRLELAEAIELGLNRALEDGSFQRLFERHFRADIDRAALDERRIIRLGNPLLNPKTPLERPELWFQP